MSIWRWRELFLDLPAERRLSLGEGGTPLIRSRSIGRAAGLENLWFKLEGVNPTGSYKDRFAAAAVSQMAHAGKRCCIATSSGNTGAALAAYCAAAGVACEVAVVEPAPAEKLKQMLAYGARLYKVRGFGIDPDVTRRTLDEIRRKAAAPDAALQISAFAFSPIGMSGVQTIAYELHEQAGDRLDHVFVPAGGGGLTLAVARGFEELATRQLRPVGPRVECVQPAGNDTIAGPLRAGDERARAVNSTTRISGLQVSSVLDGDAVIAACRRSGGTGHLVGDDAVWTMQARLAREEGIFCEPAAAASVAAAIHARAAGEIAGDAAVCCLITGVGFKDQPSVDRMITGDCPMIDVETLEGE